MSTITIIFLMLFAKAKEIVLYSFGSLNNGSKGFSGFTKVLPGITVIMSLAAAVMNIVNFFITTGYGPQIQAIREGGLDGGAVEKYGVPLLFPLIIALFIIFEIVGSIIETGKNGKAEGMTLLKISAFSWFYYIILMPLLTYAVMNAPALGWNLILIIAAILLVGFLFGVLGTGAVGSAAGPAQGKSEIDRKIEKKKQRAANLRKQAGDYSYYNKRQAEGAWGYQHMNADLNREKIRDLEKEAQYLDKEIKKLEDKK